MQNSHHVTPLCLDNKSLSLLVPHAPETEPETGGIVNVVHEIDRLIAVVVRPVNELPSTGHVDWILSRIRPLLQPSWNVSSLRGPAAFRSVRSVNCGEKARRVITFPTTPPPVTGLIQSTSQKYRAIGVDFTANYPVSSAGKEYTAHTYNILCHG